MSEFPCFPDKDGSHYRRLYSSSRLLQLRKIRLLSSQFLVVSFWRERHYFIDAFILGAWNGYVQETFHSVGSMQEEEGANWVKELTWPCFSIQKLSLSTRAYCSSLTRDLRAVERKCMHSIRSSCEVLNWWLVLCVLSSLLVYPNHSVLVKLFSSQAWRGVLSWTLR